MFSLTESCNQYNNCDLFLNKSIFPLYYKKLYVKGLMNCSKANEYVIHNMTRSGVYLRITFSNSLLQKVLILGPVMGASFHAPRHRNSMYVQTVIRSIYETIQPEHPHLSIRWYKRRPQGPPSSAPLHGILSVLRTRPYSMLCLRPRLWPHASPLLSQSPQALHRCIKIPLISESII